MNIILDLDDTLGDLTSAMVRAIKRYTGLNVDWRVWQDVEFQQANNLYPHDIIEILTKDDTVSKMKPFPDTKMVLDKLVTLGYNIHIVTARGWHPDGQNITEAWFLANDLPFTEVHVTSLFGSKLEYIKSKFDSVVCAVDDNVAHCQEFHECATVDGLIVDAFMYSRPWNVDVKNINRISTLQQIVPHLTFIKENCHEAYQQKSNGSLG